MGARFPATIYVVHDILTARPVIGTNGRPVASTDACDAHGLMHGLGDRHVLEVRPIEVHNETELELVWGGKP